MFALGVILLLAGYLWFASRRENTGLPLACQLEYARARTAADTLRVDASVPISRANVRATCGVMRRAIVSCKAQDSVSGPCAARGP